MNHTHKHNHFNMRWGHCKPFLNYCIKYPPKYTFPFSTRYSRYSKFLVLSITAALSLIIQESVFCYLYIPKLSFAHIQAFLLWIGQLIRYYSILSYYPHIHINSSALICLSCDSRDHQKIVNLIVYWAILVSSLVYLVNLICTLTVFLFLPTHCLVLSY